MERTDAASSDSIPPKIGENLNNVQRRELDALLDTFVEVLDDVPGQIDITIHHINTDNSTPIHQAPRRFPHAHKESVKRNWI